MGQVLDRLAEWEEYKIYCKIKLIAKKIAYKKRIL
jgi:hypothetical protein